MSVIVEFSLADDKFKLGEILNVDGDASVVLETVVPAGGQVIPLVRHRDTIANSFEETVRSHPAVEDISVIENDEDETLYALAWQDTPDTFIEGVQQADANILEATGTPETWTFQLRFPSHQALSAFREHCEQAGIPHTFETITNPTNPDTDPLYGLTPPQREALLCAVKQGYYAIPRRISTKELADQLGISDQAVTERLRRAIVTLVTNTCSDIEQDG